MDHFDFEDAGYLTKERLCDSTRTRLTGSLSNEEYFGVSIPNKVHGLYYNYLLDHSIREQSYSLDEIGKSLKRDSIFNVFFDKVLGYQKVHSWYISVTFSQNEGKVLEKLREPLGYYTKDSILKAFSSTPELAVFLTSPNGFYYNNKKILPWSFSNKSSLWIFHEDTSYYPEIMEREEAEILFSYARLISTQLRALSLDTSKLVKKPKEEPLLPKWLENTLKIGAKVGIKYLCASIGAKIDFPDFGGDNSNNVPDFDGDFNFGGDIDIDGDFDFNGGVDLDSDLDIDDDNDFDSGSVFDQIAFHGKHFDGFNDLHKQINVPIMGASNFSATLHVYKKAGSNTIYVSDGSCYPVSTAGRSWITVGSHKFDVSKIKAKL